MPNRIRQLAAALAACGLLAAHAAPAAAQSSLLNNADREAETPVVFDAVVLRPVGFLMMCAGLTYFAVTSPLMAITRPTDMGKSFRKLVVEPARYTWVDPIGTHPPRS